MIMTSYSFSSTCEQEASCMALITLFYLRFPVSSQGLHPNNEMVIKCWHSQRRCFQHIHLKCEHDACSLLLEDVVAIFFFFFFFSFKKTYRAKTRFWNERVEPTMRFPLEQCPAEWWTRRWTGGNYRDLKLDQTREKKGKKKKKRICSPQPLMSFYVHKHASSVCAYLCV